MTDVRDQIDARVLAILDWVGAVAEPAGAAAVEIQEHLALASRGGKSFRGRLVVAAAAAFGGGHHEAILDTAAALELFQTAALIHDDVLDASDTRRGRPATHRAFEATHRARAGVGDPEAFGRAGAILTGDIALIAALHAAATASRRADPRVESLFAEMAVLVTAGQHLDMREATVPLDPATLATSVERVMRSKTASYTAEMPLALGAALAGADDASITAVRAAGIPLGIAFQLRDDLLGVVGAPGLTGKPVGDDLREGKRTLVIAHLLEHGSSAARERVLAVLGDATASEAAVADAIDSLRTSGAIEAVELRIASTAETARALLSSALPDPEPVLELVDAAVSRTS